MLIVMLALLTFQPFPTVFKTTNTYIIPEAYRIAGDSNRTTYRQYCSVNPAGNIVALIDYSRKRVVAFDLVTGDTTIPALPTSRTQRAWGPVQRKGDTILFSDNPTTVSETGRRSSEAAIPVAVNFSGTGQLFVADAGNRRISAYDSALQFHSSFLLPTNVGTPSNAAVLENGNFLCANLKIDSASTINAGHWCNIFSPKGELLRSFAYTPKEAVARNLWLGVNSLIDVDENQHIYVAFTIAPHIDVYTTGGDLTDTYDVPADWWVLPPRIEPPPFNIRNEPPDFFGRWTRLVKLLYLGQGKLLLASESNKLVKDCDKRFIIDVFDTRSRTVLEHTCTDYLPVGVDAAGRIYFLSLNGRELIQTVLAPGMDR
jgi:hypothetical protein